MSIVNQINTIPSTIRNAEYEHLCVGVVTSGGLVKMLPCTEKEKMEGQTLIFMLLEPSNMYSGRSIPTKSRIRLKI